MIHIRANFKHFRKRLSERYGLTITNREYKLLCDEIKMGGSNHGFLTEAKSRSKSIHWIEFKSKIIYVVYHKRSHTLVTALPSDYNNIAGEDYFRAGDNL